MADFGFGAATFGKYELGDGSNIHHNKGALAIPLTYLVGQPGHLAYPLTFKVQGAGALAVWCSYWVVPPLTQFAIDGDVAVPWPHSMQYTPPAVAGVDLSGIELVQGFGSVTWSYEWLTDDMIAVLMAHYDPMSPTVMITFPNELGNWVQKSATMNPPVLGTRQTVTHQGVTITFSHVSPD